MNKRLFETGTYKPDTRAMKDEMRVTTNVRVWILFRTDLAKNAGNGTGLFIVMAKNAHPKMRSVGCMMRTAVGIATWGLIRL